MTRSAADLSDQEVADVLGKAVITVQKWCKTGKLAGAYKAGRSWRIPEDALDAVQRDAVRRAARGPLYELMPHLQTARERLRRARGPIAEADRDGLRDLLSALDALGAEVNRAGRAAQERQRELDRQPRLRTQSR